MKNINNIIKLDKEDTNLLLNYINLKDKKYGLILRLAYIYGRHIRDILKLQKTHYDSKHNILDFTFLDIPKSFSLHKDIKEEFKEYINSIENNNDYLFINHLDELTIIRKELDKLILESVKEINHKQLLRQHCPIISGKDFRKLRAQHLFIDGVSIEVINQLLLNKNIHSFKKFINYDELLLLKFPCSSLTNLFEYFTDLNIFHDADFENVDLINISKDDESVVFEYDYINLTISIIKGNNESLIKWLEDIDKQMLNNIVSNINVGDYKIIDGIQLLKN